METKKQQKNNRISQKDLSLLLFGVSFLLIGVVGFMSNQTWLLIFPVIASALMILVHPFWGMLLFTALLPLESSFLASGGDTTTVTRYLGIFVFGVWLFKTMFNKQKIALPPIMFNAALLVLWGGLSVLWALNVNVMLSRLMTAVQLLILLFLVINFVKNKQRLNALLAALLIGCIIALLLGLFGVGVADYGKLLTLKDQGVKEYGTYVGIVFFVGSLLYFYQKGAWRWFGFFGVLLAMVTLIRVNQRGVLLAIGVSWLAIAAVSKQKLKTIILILLVVLAFNSAVDLLFNSGIIDDYMLERLSVQDVIETGGTGRVEIWAIGLRMFKDNVFSGVGWGNYHIAYPRYAYNVNIQAMSQYVAKDSHSDIIGLAGELGILGVIFFLIFLARIIFMDIHFLVDLKKGNYQLPSLIIFGLLIYIFINGFTSTFLYRKVYWLILGLGIMFPKLSDEL